MMLNRIFHLNENILKLPIRYRPILKTEYDTLKYMNTTAISQLTSSLVDQGRTIEELQKQIEEKDRIIEMVNSQKEYDKLEDMNIA